MNRGILVTTILSVFLVSCEKTVDTPVEYDFDRPFLREISVSPRSFNTDTILINGQTNPQDIITLSLVCNVRVDVPQGTPPPIVNYQMVRPSDEKFYGSDQLRDDGIQPDAIGGDGIYSGAVNFSLMRVEGGYFELSLSAVDESGNPSNTLKERILVFRSSRAPHLSGLSAPDTVVLPPPNLVSLILLSITANDSDGLEDIEEVFFRNLDSPSDTTRKFFMYDDGDVNGVSGDSVSGDGVFSVTVQLPYNTPVGTYRFRFEATDRFGLGSTTILHPLSVLGPE